MRIAAAVASALLAGQAAAQAPELGPELAPPGEVPPAMEAPAIEDPAPPPDTDMSEREAELDRLFTELAAAEGEAWRPIQNRIWVLWARSPSPSMTFLLSRAIRAMEEQKLDLAEAFLDDLVRLDPDFAEGWNRRATLHFMREDFGQAVADIQRTLALEPRHFGALSGLGLIMERLDQDRNAYRAYTRALEINPHLETVREAVDRLAPEVEGRPL